MYEIFYCGWILERKSGRLVPSHQLLWKGILFQRDEPRIPVGKTERMDRV